MSEVSKSFHLQTFSDSPTSSPESASGATHCERQDTKTTSQSGPDRAHASPSARRGDDQASLTLDISGQIGFGSSESAALRASLENRLRALTDSLGSTMYSLIWRERATPQRRLISALRASALRTSDSGSTSQRSGWATPMAHEARLGYQNRRNGKRGTQESLTTEAVNNLAPEDDPRLASGTAQTGSRVATGSCVQLSPAHSRWLMGLPAAWDDCAPTETRSSARSPRSSSKP